MRFVSESLPRLISRADGSDPLPQTLVFEGFQEEVCYLIIYLFTFILCEDAGRI